MMSFLLLASLAQGEDLFLDNDGPELGRGAQQKGCSFARLATVRAVMSRSRDVGGGAEFQKRAARAARRYRSPRTRTRSASSKL